MSLYWRTRDMLHPQLVYSKNTKTNEVACVASLVPTFEPVEPQEEIDIANNEEPEMTELLAGDEFHFIFIVDRSGSMGSRYRMQAAREALSIFIRSLPTGCRFSILSFGTRFTWLTGAPNQEGNMLSYDEATKDYAL